MSRARSTNGVVDVAIGITVSGAGLNASVIYDDALLFPLRLGFACAVGVPLATVSVVNVSGFVDGALNAFFPVPASALVNVRTAACPNSNRLLASIAESADTRLAPRAPLRRIAYAASASTRVNGTYVVVDLKISVVVPDTVIAAAGGNLSSIAAVSGVVASINGVLPGTANASISGVVYGPFLNAAAALVGSNASLFALGSAGSPFLTASTPAASGTGATTAGNSPSGGSLAAGAIAGIAVALILLLTCAVLVCCLVARGRRKERKAVTSPAPSTADDGALPAHSNPLRRAQQDAAAPQTSLPVGGGSEPLGPLKPPPHAKAASSSVRSGGDSLPVMSNPMLALRELYEHRRGAGRRCRRAPVFAWGFRE